MFYFVEIIEVLSVVGDKRKQEQENNDLFKIVQWIWTKR